MKKHEQILKTIIDSKQVNYSKSELIKLISEIGKTPRKTAAEKMRDLVTESKMNVQAFISHEKFHNIMHDHLFIASDPKVSDDEKRIRIVTLIKKACKKNYSYGIDNAFNDMLNAYNKLNKQDAGTSFNI